MKITSGYKKAVVMAILAALLYGISSPVSKLLLEDIPPTLMAACLYIGAGLGMFIVNIFRMLSKKKQVEAKITKKELPFVVAMIILDIAAPILLMIGLTMTTSGNVALLNNFEIVATSMIALVIFKEAIGKRMWLAIGFITLASVILSIEDISSFSFSLGSLFVIGASVCWGFENNSTRMLSLKDPLQIVVIKGFGSGIGALLIALFINETSNNIYYILSALILGFVAYGLSIFFYIKAQRELGAARTSAYYAAAPFIGVIMSWLILQEGLTVSFFIAIVVMLVGTYFAVTENHSHRHLHTRLHHEHKHNHQDGHHNHHHDQMVHGEHSHVHIHEAQEHEHPHTPDMHHRHDHS